MNHNTTSAKRKLSLGLATIMMSILLGAALVAPAGTAFANGGNDHENESKDKDRKDKDKDKDKDHEHDNDCKDDHDEHGKKKTDPNNEKYCKIRDLTNDLNEDGKEKKKIMDDIAADGSPIDLTNDQKAVKDAKDKLDSDKKAHKSKLILAADEAALDAAQNKLDKDKDHNQDIIDDAKDLAKIMKDITDDTNELNALMH